MNDSFQYPARAQGPNAKGMVWLEYLVDQQGNIQRPEINQSAEYSLDEEAWRLIKKSPAWVPATRDGKAVHHISGGRSFSSLLEQPGREAAKSQAAAFLPCELNGTLLRA